MTNHGNTGEPGSFSLHDRDAGNAMNNPNHPHEKGLRKDPETSPAQPGAPPGTAVDDEDPDQSPMDESPARRKDRSRDEPKHGPRHTPTDEADGVGPYEDTYD
jgi:hypothetical protein